MASTDQLKPSGKNGHDRATQIEVPGGDAQAFRTEAYRQSLAVSTSPSAQADQAFIDAVSVSNGE